MTDERRKDQLIGHLYGLTQILEKVLEDSLDIMSEAEALGTVRDETYHRVVKGFEKVQTGFGHLVRASGEMREDDEEDTEELEATS